MEDISLLITSDLLEALQAEYHLKWTGMHGFAHWCRVRENGLRLAEKNGANPRVVEYFAFLHDNQRLDDGHDSNHGRRASQIIREKFIDKLKLTPKEIDLLCEACDSHTFGFTDADITVQTCWDADRLDLMRVGIMPDPRHLCTDLAKTPQIIAWAVERSLRREGSGS